MKRRVAVLMALALVASACGGGEEETRNAVITPKVQGGNTTGTFGWVSNLDYDPATKSVYGGGWVSGVEEGLVLKGAGVLDTGNPANLSVPQSFPEVNGMAETVLPDGSGGWYMAGNMSLVGAIRNRHLVHVMADGTVDPVFDPQLVIPQNPFGRSRQVLLLADHPASPEHLLLISRFSRVGDTPFAGDAATCARAVIVNKATGAVTDRIDFDGSCPESVALWGRQVVVAGSFAVFKGRARNRVAGIDLVTKAVTTVGLDFGTVYPTFSAADGGQTIGRIAVVGDVLYALGRISKAGQLAASIDLTTGLVTRWKPAELIPAGVMNWQVSKSTMLVSQEKIVVAGCLGGLTPTGFAAYDRVSGERVVWDPKINWPGEMCPGGFEAISTGDTLLVQGQFTKVNDKAAPNVVWLDPDASARPVQLPVAVSYGDWAQPHSPIRNARFFPELKRMFVAVDEGSLMVNGRNMGPYLASDDRGVTRPTRINWTLPNQTMNLKVPSGGDLYVMSTSADLDPNAEWLDPDAVLAADRVIHRFDAATGERDTAFEINHTGLVSYRLAVGETAIAVIGSRPDAGGLGGHVWFHSKATGRSLGVFPDEGIAPRWPWALASAAVQGDTLFGYGPVPDGQGTRYALFSVDMKTGTPRLYNVDLGTEQACWCDPVVIGSYVFAPMYVPRGPNVMRAINIETGEVVRDMTEWSINTELPAVKVGSRIVVPTLGQQGFGFAAVDADSLEPSGPFAAGTTFSMVSAVLGTPDRLYAWSAHPVRQTDGTVITGLVAFDTEGKLTMASVPDPVVSMEVMPQDPVIAPAVPEGPPTPEGLTVPTENPAEVQSRRVADAAAGRISLDGVVAGNRSLTVRFTSNGNDSPYDVRQVGGKKVCTTSGNSCTFANLTAHSKYSFTVESRGKADQTRSQPSSAAQPVVILKKGKTLKLSTVIKPASRSAVKWKSSKACTLDAKKGTLRAPKKGAVCSVSVTSKAKGKPTVVRSITVLVG